MESGELQAVVEALIFASPTAIPMKRIREVLEGVAGRDEIREALEAIKARYHPERGGIVFVEVAGGYQFRTNPRYAEFLRRLTLQRRTVQLSQAATETLAIVAYRQPVTRKDIDAIRGVDSSGVLANLLAKRLVRVVGRHQEKPGRPYIYGTTKNFLEFFQLKSLAHLPPIEEISPSLSAKMKEEAQRPGGDGASGEPPSPSSPPPASPSEERIASL
ncbi:MAG: SMC-Scp complex subunit ScpB [Deltaproteobacteria bacterium]|nr:MAG: SMC-Scp complex subunit ScpB [Deltaproteobacteria bacterium]